MKINFEIAVLYIDTLYENDEASNKNFIGKTYLKKSGTVFDSDVSRLILLYI
jgi:hypothetical protein